MMAIVWLVVVDVVAACGAVRASAGSRRPVMLICGGFPKSLCPSHVRCLSKPLASWFRCVQRVTDPLLGVSTFDQNAKDARTSVIAEREFMAEAGDVPKEGCDPRERGGPAVIDAWGGTLVVDDDVEDAVTSFRSTAGPS